MHSILEIKSFYLPVYIGSTQKEQNKPQNICIDITLSFSKPYKAENSDKLEDTICYAFICKKIKTTIANKKFCLIEKLAGLLLKELKKNLPKKTLMRVRVQKPQTPVTGLKGGVSYTCGDKF